LRTRSKGKSTNATKRTPIRNRERYIYDDDDTDSRRDSVASLIAENGDNASTSSNFSVGGFQCGMCDPVCCGQDDDGIIDEERDFNELREMRKEIAEMKRMINPSSVSIVEDVGAPVPPSPSLRQPPSPRSPRTNAHGMQLEMKQQEPRHGKLIKLSENDLIQVETRDEEEKDRREKYYTSLGRQGYQQDQDHDDIWLNFMQCSNFCISWNNCDKGTDDSDNVSDITAPTDIPLPWNDDYHRVNVVVAPPMRTETPLALSGYNRNNTKIRPSYAGVSVTPSKLAQSSKAPSNGTPTSNSKSKNSRSTASPMSRLQRLPKSPLRSKPNKVKAKKVRDDDGSVLYEV
jgi:hypothetical protein